MFLPSIVCSPLFCAGLETLPSLWRWVGSLFVRQLSALLAQKWVPIMDYQYKYSFREELFEAEFAQALTVVGYWGNEEKSFSLPSNCKNWKSGFYHQIYNVKLGVGCKCFTSLLLQKQWMAESDYVTNCWRISMSNGGVEVGCFYKDCSVSGRAIMDLEGF